jgi:AcrR family transcriptional regulator
MPRVAALAAEREELSARTRIVDAAERLFAEHGYHAVSLRTVMALAQVNVAAAHYYFGSKKNLLQAVLDRRATQINQARKERLLRCLERNGKTASVEKILEAYVGPALEVCSDPGGQLFVRVSALASVDPSPDVQDIMQSTYDETARLFVDALKRACPRLREADLYWRLSCVYGAMLYLRANNGRVARILGRKAGPLDTRAVHEALRHVVPFLAAGLSLPPRAKADS